LAPAAVSSLPEEVTTAILSATRPLVSLQEDWLLKGDKNGMLTHVGHGLMRRE
jgi:hypothetical protein